jgi:CHAT domain-containing protein/lipoprotein NlpI
LLGELSETDAQPVELRLLEDPAFAEEFDMMVNSLVDQYLQDELSPEDRDKAERHFFRSAQRREKLRFAAALKRRKAEMKRRHERRKSRGPYLRAAAIAFIALGASGIIFKTYFARPSLTQGVNALQSAYREQRPLQSRISGFGYAAAPNERGGPSKVDSNQLSLAATIILGILDKDRQSPGVDVLQAAGQYYASQGQFDAAIDQFKHALELDQTNARSHNDLGAALLERGKARLAELEDGQENEDFGNSLLHLNKALQLDNANLEALFNRALLYEAMLLLPQAENDWRKYLERDPNSEWSAEARKHLQRLEDERSRAPGDPVRDFREAYKQGDEANAWEVVRRNYSSAGNTITNALLDSYLQADAAGDNSAAENELTALAFLGKLEVEKAGDVYTSDLAGFYKRSSFQKRKLLAQARASMAEAYDLFLRSHVDDALERYSKAEQTFRATGDEAEATLALYRMGHCYWSEPDLKKSEEIFTRLRDVTQRSNYKWLSNQSLYRTASIRSTYNDYTETINYAEQVLSESEKMGDVIGIVNALVMLSEQYRYLNNPEKSWSYLHRAFMITSERGGESLQQWAVLTAVGLTLNGGGLYEAALEYQKESLRLAQQLKPERPLIISFSYDYVGQTYALLKNYEAALSNINQAFDYGRQLADERSGIAMMGQASFHAGDVYREERQYANAINSYDNSITYYGQIEYPFFTYPARKGKLLSYWALGDDAATETELNSVLKIFDDYRAKLKRESQRNTFFNVEQSVYDLAIEFAWSRKNDRELALKYAEISRARSLLDAMHKDSRDIKTGDDAELPLFATTTPLSPDEIKNRLPPDAQIVQYAVLSDRVLIWVITRNDIKTEERKITAGEFEAKIRRFVESIGTLPGKQEPSFKNDAIELHKILIAPIESLLDKDKLTCIVADKVLHYVPFEALISEDTGQYVVEKFRLQSAPSSSIFLTGLDEPHPPAEQSDERILSVGDPTFNRGDFPSLQSLPDARDEARNVAAFYNPPRTVLLDRQATERAVKNGLQKADVAHFAVHYVVDERQSLLSKMLLTPLSKTMSGKDDDGLLQIQEIYRMNLSRMHLVVLSACQTAIERKYNGEGVVGGARPFIAAGVPLVVASLWPVDSTSTAQLMTIFHRYRKQDKLPTAAALQQAQLSVLNGDDKRYRHPYYWAAFTVIGRYEKF